MFGEIINSGSGPALEAAMRFAAQRQKLIANNIANITTPNFVQQDVSVADFQTALGEAIDRRRSASGLAELSITGNSEVEMDSATGALTLRPESTIGGILFHDRNNRDLESLMQAQVENATMFRVCADLLKNRSDLMRAAIGERV
ncbi:MAG TPA: flagellar basal body protein [Phycisphaerales bacterium]|nr:flagellar basal body protein [Phycisphaerales bacterium]